jgi:hypothetical protein
MDTGVHLCPCFYCDLKKLFTVRTIKNHYKRDCNYVEASRSAGGYPPQYQLDAIARTKIFLHRLTLRGPNTGLPPSPEYANIEVSDLPDDMDVSFASLAIGDISMRIEDQDCGDDDDESKSVRESDSSYNNSEYGKYEEDDNERKKINDARNEVNNGQDNDDISKSAYLLCNTIL